MLKIRKDVFETNSSSCHTLVIKNNTQYDTISLDGPQLCLCGGEYGWNYENLVSAEDKANYVATLLKYINESCYNKELSSWAKINEKICKDNFEQVVKEQTGAKEIIYNLESAYIDHQSCESASDFKFLLDKNKIKNLIFGKASYIVIDNDNHW